MDILVNVVNQKLKIATNFKTLVDGTQEFIRFVFNLPNDWDKLTTFAQFRQNGVAYNQYLDEENCAFLPSEIQTGTCTLMLYGSGGKVIATTNYLTLNIDENILVNDAESTEISLSLYNQLVSKVGELELKIDDIANNDIFDDKIEDIVKKEMQEYLDSGALANMTIKDGSITRAKAAPDLEEILKQAENAMKPSVYDPQNYRIDIFAYAQSRADVVQQNLDKVKNEIKGAYKLSETVNYTNLGDALRGAIKMANGYSQALLVDYNAFTIKILSDLPLTGDENVFYLIPNSSGGYDKWWWITDDNGVSKWDTFGSASTVVVDSLPSIGDENVDYILKSDIGYSYYKYIDGKWEMVAGSLAYVGETLPETGSESTDYYILTESGAYAHYRYIGGEFKLIGGDAYSKDGVDGLISELNKKIEAVQNNIQNLESAINDSNGRIALIDAKVDALGNLVSDITESESGIEVHYKDGSKKTVDTKDVSVKVEDVNKSESGIAIVYTDGSTKDIEISGGGGGETTSGSASITRITESSTQCVYGDSCPITYVFNAIDSAGDMVGDGTATWFVGNIKKATTVAHQGENSFDIGQYLSVGTNNIKLSISVDTGGETPTITTKSWSVNAINMYATWDYDDTTINESETVAIRWTPYGDLLKTTHIVIDGTEVVTSETTRSGVMQYATINKYPHGSHMTELYLTATVNRKEIRSESIYHDMIFAESGNPAPVISCSIQNRTMTQYNTMKIPVVIYHPGKLTTNAILAVDGKKVADWTNIDRTVHYWNYTPSEFGEKTLTITCGETVKTIVLDVKKLDIDNEEISGYAFRLKASDIATNEALKAWNSNGVDISFSDNFDWNNGGIKTETDENGNIRQYICVKAGTTATINYELFGNDPRTTGKNFKVIFKPTNSRDFDATFLECIDSGIGIRLGANGGIASSEQNTISVQYAEDSYTEFEFDIRPDSEYRYIQTYLDGVLSSTTIYAVDDNFTQTDKKKIVIGSADCDVCIYMVKAYEAYLTPDNHIENFIADAPNAQEMVARFERNDILTEGGEISYEKLAEKNPNCRVHLWSIPRMTEGKKDYVENCSYQQIYAAGDQSHQITADGVRISIQGTSSVDYKDAGANTDGKFTKGFTDGNGKHIDGYSMTDNSIPVNYFNTKVNIASCENINNMCLAEWYNRFQPYKTLWRRKNPKARDCMEHHMGVQFIHDQSHGLFADDNYHMYAICNMGNSKKNLNVFHDESNPKECCIENLTNDVGFSLMTEPNFTIKDLEDESAFEFRYPDNPTNEMKQAFVDFVNWMQSVHPGLATGNKLPSSVTYGAYTFKGTGQEDEVLAGLTIEDYVGTYTHDTYEYRMAKMLNECEEHLIMDSIVYHYVFVEQHTMVDSVCKNTFWGTEDLVHWHLVKNYDNDTADGNNNTGKLVIPYGCEGMDALGDGDVFNGKTSAWWTFIHGLYEARRAMWISREAAGAWNAKAYLAYAKECQNVLPERVYNQDYWYKYLRLYEQKDVTRYLAMLEGGKKNHQRESFVTNNQFYMAGQYMGIANTSRSITLRGYTPSSWAGVEPKSEVSIMLYTKGYIVVQVANTFKRVKAEKGQFYTVSFPDSGQMNDTVINLHGANLIRAVGDISCLYIGSSDFSAATRLRSLQIGSTAEGYKNNNLTNIGFGTNTMLEHLFIQNCPNVKSTLDLSGCQALKELDVRGSGFTGITFAVGGLINKALLCSPASLNMRSLYYLADENLSLESYDTLSTIRLEDCPYISSYNLINLAENLNRARILDIDWTLPDTILLNKMLLLIGLDENDHNTPVSVLTGKVYVSGQIRNQELERYAEAWGDLIITYDPKNLVDQYLATYVNTDGTVLYTTYVDRGATPPDPVAEGWIEVPTAESDEQYTYTYKGWDDITSAMLAPRTITVAYTKTVRKYNVTWYSRAGLPLGSVEASYGDEVVYDGETPVNTSEEGSYFFNLFAGWDKSTGYIRGDTDVYAVWERTSLPPAEKDLKDMTTGEIHAVIASKRTDDYFTLKDYSDITLGHDFNFSNVESELLAEKLLLDGNTAKKTSIQLFGKNEKSFTLAIDFQFTDETSNNTLLSCFEENGSEGFRLRYNGGFPNIQWGDKSVNIGYKKHRDIIVLRHIKGEDKLYIYASNGTSSSSAFDPAITKIESIRSRKTDTDTTLTLGGVMFGDGSFDDYGRGMIHWCKIWYDDLGDTNAKELAAWYHEPLRMEFDGSGKYRLAGNTSQRSNASFIANNLLQDRGYYMNSSSTNVGGWDESKMREFCNTRLYDALPTPWQAMVKPVKINTTAGNKSNEIIISEDKVYLECITALTNNQTFPYPSEGDYIPWFTSDILRAKSRGVIIADDANYYTSASEPSTISSNHVKAGDVWKPSNGGGWCYFTISEEDWNLYNSISGLGAQHGVHTNDGKLVWFSATYWWLRSPNITYASSFWYVNGNGSYSGGASGTYGICPCFSI